MILLLKLGYLTQSLEYDKLSGSNFVELELKRMLKIRNEHDKDKDGDASTNMGVSKSQSRKTSETEEIQLPIKKKKKPQKPSEPEPIPDYKYEDLLVEIAEGINLKKENLLKFLEVKNKPEDFENGAVITSGINKILR